MNGKELLDALRAEATLARARYYGAMEAYKREALDQAESEVYARGIYRGNKVIYNFTYYVFDKVVWYQNGQLALIGKRVLKSGKPSKANAFICDFSSINCLTKSK